MKYSQWGWNNQGQLLENRIPGAQEIIDPNSRLNVKITPNSITLPSTRIVEDDPNRAEFDDCPNTINSTNMKKKQKNKIKKKIIKKTTVKRNGLD